MQVKFLGKQYTISLDSLPERTVDGLKAQIKKDIPQCAALSNDKIMLFYNKAKISGDGSLSLDDEKLKITDESTIFVVVISSNERPAAHSASAQPAATQSARPADAAPAGAAGAVPGAMPMMGDPTAMIENMFKNPEMLENMIEMVMPNATPQQKAMFRESTEALRKNPELFKQMMANMQAGGMHPMMAGMAGQMPGMPSPMMMPGMQGQAPGMPSPGHSPMGYPMGYGYYPPPMVYPPYMMPPVAGAGAQGSPAPKEGPCSHGFYPPKYVDGVAMAQNAEDVYVKQLQTLEEMGFKDREMNLKALVEARGDMTAALDLLMNKK